MRKLLYVLLAIAVVVAAVLVATTLLAQPAGDCPACLPDHPRPLVIAHQGGDGVWPGDTMFAFEKAAALGVDMLEMACMLPPTATWSSCTTRPSTAPPTARARSRR
jgi:glycerophosphoryl diester phosphodiesterase